MEQPIPPLIQPSAPKRTGWIVYSVIATFFLFLSLLAGFVLLGLLADDGPTLFEGKRHRHYYECYLQGDTDTRNKIAVVYLTGIISGGYDGDISQEGMVGDIKAQLAQAVEDTRVKAIILRINSPGGEVVASDAIYQALVKVRDDHRKPIVASIESVGASGAYYAAMGCSHLMATDLTITGSIGVIMQSFGFGGLMDKVGVKSHTFKSGKYKDLLNPTRAPTEDEKAMVNTLIMEVYDKFVGIVANERKLDVNELKSTLADGRILSGHQALRGKLIDGIGYFDDAVDKAMELANLKKAKVITYQAPFSLSRLFRFFGESKSGKIQIQVGPTLPKLETGKLYFLPAYMFQ
ncbi:MAG: signal peptide peptidase SppA [Verrucomicrobia bacterium]|nr:signal peptide peptidase SppA [Verrucomicrobiota bacterium]